jgi:predicted phage terminase large subunit-like protein
VELPPAILIKKPTDLPPGLRELQYRECEKDLRAFVRCAWHIVEPETPFKPNWHLDAIADHLMGVSLGHIRRLIINIPPRHGKSATTSAFWPAWEWIQWPHIRSIFLSFKMDLSLRDSVNTRRVIESEWYQARWGDRFYLLDDQNMKRRFDNDKLGFRQSNSFEAGATGEGGDKVVADDPIDLDEQDNLRAMERAAELWDGVFSSRLNDPQLGARVVIMQRMHERDLSGHLLATAGNYLHLMLPAEYDSKRKCVTFGSVRPVPLGTPSADPSPWGKRRASKVAAYQRVKFEDPRSIDDELMWPSHFTADVVAAAKTPGLGQGPWRFAAQYNQNPVPRDGEMFPPKHWQYWTRPPMTERSTLKFDDWLQSWDCTFKDLADSDYVVGQIWAKLGVNYYLIDQVRGRWSFTRTCDEIKLLSKRWPQAVRKLVEDKANGTAIMDALKKTLPGLVPVEPLGGKIARAFAVQPLQEGGNLYLPADGSEWIEGAGSKMTWVPHFAAWVPDFVTECARFPKGVNDDQVDAMTQALNYWIPKANVGIPMPIAIAKNNQPWQGIL